ncbi:MAG: hypothetical protein JXR78_01990 [Victivallales bacterium]|nr:hypothetical protein [Victivallales bacterium]
MIRAILAFAFLSGITLLSGCMSEYEKRGISNIPQNSPANWENPSYQDITR